MMRVAAVVLAAGEGSRMKSDLPKVLHPLAGRPMLRWVLEALRGAGVGRIWVVVGHGAAAVRAAGRGWLPGIRPCWAVQGNPRGTGDALASADDALGERRLLVVCGDAPLVEPETLRRLLTQHVRDRGRAATVLTALAGDPAGYGRVIRGSDGRVARIVEDRDATHAERAIREVNSGAYVFEGGALRKALASVRPNNAKGEYYLTDVVRLLGESGARVGAWAAPGGEEEILGVNTRVELARAGAVLRRRVLEKLMRGGVTVVDPAATYVDAGVRVGRDTTIWPNTHLRGKTIVGRGCVLGPSTMLTDAAVGDRAEVVASVLASARIGAGARIGPFAHLRPGAVIGSGAKVGNFTEIKGSVIGNGSKVPHLSYIGDAEIGAGVNVGAGTITCNYDGVRKSRTVIGAGAFIGSNANLVAPVRIGRRAVIGAGSTITEDVPSEELALARARKVGKPGWARRSQGARRGAADA